MESLVPRRVANCVAARASAVGEATRGLLDPVASAIAANASAVLRAVDGVLARLRITNPVSARTLAVNRASARSLGAVALAVAARNLAVRRAIGGSFFSSANAVAAVIRGSGVSAFPAVGWAGSARLAQAANLVTASSAHCGRANWHRHFS